MAMRVDFKSAYTLERMYFEQGEEMEKGPDPSSLRRIPEERKNDGFLFSSLDSEARMLTLQDPTGGKNKLSLSSKCEQTGDGRRPESNVGRSTGRGER